MLPYLILAVMLSLTFSLFDSYQFIQYGGSIKRGLRIGTGYLSTEILQQLRDLKTNIVRDTTNAFIRKEGQMVLIQPRSFWGARKFGLWYIGLVDLAKEQPKIEYRAPVSVFMIGLTIAVTLSYQFIYATQDISLSSILAPILIFLMYVLMHPFSKHHVINYLEEALRSKNA